MDRSRPLFRLVSALCAAASINFAAHDSSRAAPREPGEGSGCQLSPERLTSLEKAPALDLDVVPLVFRGDYYTKMQWRRLTPKIEPSIFEAISADIAPERSELLPGLALPGGGCGDCAVVGASGNLRGSGYGGAIDRHRIVIRTSHAPLAGYEKDVGTRSSYHVMVANLGIPVEYDPGALLIVTPRNDESMHWLISRTENGSMRTPATRIRVLAPSFTEYVQRNWFRGSKRWASTGFRALVFALHYCDSVDAYGFGPDAEGNWDHYYDLEKKLHSDNKFHDIGLESKLIEELAEKGLIRLHRGNADRR